MKNDREQLDSTRPAKISGGISRIPVAVVALWLLLSAVGCGRQDRLDPVSPPAPDELPTQAWGTIEDQLPIIFWPYRPTAIGAWSSDDLLIGMRHGVIIRKTGDRLHRMDLPETDWVYGITCRPDGTAVALDHSGTVWNWEGGGWTEETELYDTNFYGIFVDDLDRTWAYGNDGKLARDNGDRWQRFALPYTLDIDDGWVDAEGIGWFVTGTLDVIRVMGDVWTTTTLPEPNLDDSRKVIEGDDTGRLVVAASGRHYLWIFDGSEWTRRQPPEDPDPSLTDVFWQNGELYGVFFRAGGIGRWDGSDWIERQELPGLGSYNYAISIPVGAGRVVGSSGGVLYHFDGSAPFVISPPLEQISATASVDGVLHVGYRSGEYLVQDGPEWRLMPRVLPEYEQYLSGGLVAAGNQGILHSGTGELILVEPGGDSVVLGRYPTIRSYLQDDQTILIGGTEAIYDLDAGALRLLGRFTDRPRPLGICRDGADGFFALDSRRLLGVSEEHQDVLYTFSGWSPRNLVRDPARGLVIFGDDKTLLQTAAGTRDVSPWQTIGSLDRRQPISDLCLDGQGGWLAAGLFTTDLLRYDGEGWSRLDHALPATGDLTEEAVFLQPTGEGDFLITSSYLLLRLEPEGGAP